ncbi:hypothetical protein [Mesobacillus zeae]|uniref:ABC transporter permease subunit n=1 Tax=Mesobacillus zeae TaxID=1917180 RepID=A0A398BM61_9BACI|nr:hypothetical protein [Mesobacillus zeae]RID88453.1 hypothetical protein D1970_01765 [Mesobacillus zeae]
MLQDLAFNVEEYFASIQKLAVNMLTMKDLTFDGTHPIFPGVFDRYVLSLKLMVLLIISVITLSFLVSYSVVLIFIMQKKYILNGIETLWSLPDLVSIFLLQPFFIWVTKMILVYRIFSELDKNYAQFTKAKGLSSLNILNVHILRNIWQDLLLPSSILDQGRL